MARTLVLTSTFPQWEGDPRGAFIRRYWEARSGRGRVEVLAPRTRWCSGELRSPLEIHRFCYAPKPCSTLSGQFGILENLRARPHRSSLVPPFLLAMFAALRRRLPQAMVPQVAAACLRGAPWRPAAPSTTCRARGRYRSPLQPSRSGRGRTQSQLSTTSAPNTV